MDTPSPYSAAVAGLVTERRLNPLGPGTPNERVRPVLEALDLEGAFAPQPVRDRQMASSCLAGLWLYHNFLDESHRISQEVDTPTGSYWHGLMHRREPDFGNSAYWFRRVGRHPAFEPLRSAAARLAAAAALPSARFLVNQPHWDPFAFLELCESALSGDAAVERLCREIQQTEWESLFDFCYRHAVGP